MRLTSPYVSEADLSQSIYEISKRLPNSTLEVLSHTPLWEDVKKASEDQNWWFERTELLIQRVLGPDFHLQHRIGDWARVYASIERNGPEFKSDQDYGSTLLIQVLLEIGADTSNTSILSYAASSATEEGFRLLLDDPDIGIDQDEGDPLVSAALVDNVPVLRLLLADERFDPDHENSAALRIAVEDGNTASVELLLDDPRVDASGEHNEALFTAGKYRFYDIVDLLLADEKVQRYAASQVDGYGLEQAVLHEDTALLKRLLTQQTLDIEKKHGNWTRLDWLLILAAKIGSVAVTQFLLDNAPERISESGVQIAFETAMKRRNYSVRDLLPKRYPNLK